MKLNLITNNNSYKNNDNDTYNNKNNTPSQIMNNKEYLKKTELMSLLNKNLKIYKLLPNKYKKNFKIINTNNNYSSIYYFDYFPMSVIFIADPLTKYYQVYFCTTYYKYIKKCSTKKLSYNDYIFYRNVKEKLGLNKILIFKNEEKLLDIIYLINFKLISVRLVIKRFCNLLKKKINAKKIIRKFILKYGVNYLYCPPNKVNNLGSVYYRKSYKNFQQLLECN